MGENNEYVGRKVIYQDDKWIAVLSKDGHNNVFVDHVPCYTTDGWAMQLYNEDEDFKGRNFAIFGGGDQKGYPENFVDGIGIMTEFIEERGGIVLGFTSTEGYEFEGSRAQRGDQFTGLALDIENQAALSNERIEKWVGNLKKDFK